MYAVAMHAAAMHYLVVSNVGGQVGEGGQLLGEVVHAHDLFSDQSAYLGHTHVHSQGLLATQEVVEFSIVVRLPE